MTTNAWGVAPAATSWADDVNEEEQAGTLPPASTDFPSLGEAVKQQPQKAPKKKPQKMNLTTFMATGPPVPAPFVSKHTDQDIRSLLPTAPRGERSENDDDRSGMLGGGFKEYGGFRGGAGGFGGREERPERRRDDDFQASRADDVDDWGTVKKFTPGEGGGRSGGGGFGGERRGGGGGFGGDRPPSGVDEVDDWGTTKKFEPSSGRPAGGGGGAGGGFRDAPRRGFGEGMEASRADEEDQWGKSRVFQPSEPSSRGGPSGGARGFGFSDRGPAAEEDRWARRGPPEDSQPLPSATTNGAPAPAERPRLKLQPRTVPIENKPEAAASEATASAPAASAPAASAPAKKSNPFGAARPREEVLKEKGIDVSKEEVKLPPVVRDEMPEEKTLKGQLEQLRKKLEMLHASAPDPESIADEIASVEEELSEKDKELVALAAELDDKARLSKAEPVREKSSDLGTLPDTPGDKQHEGRSSRARTGPPGPRGTSREAEGPFAGAPGKDRW